MGSRNNQKNRLLNHMTQNQVIEQLYLNKPESIHDVIPSEFFTKYDSYFTIPNGVFGAERASPILEFCVQSMNSSCGWYGPSWFGMTIKKFLGLPNEIPQAPVAEQLRNHNYEYFHYGKFESQYARHWSLYSWSPEVWNKLKDGVYEG
jgi:hypothetical protein